MTDRGELLALIAAGLLLLAYMAAHAGAIEGQLDAMTTTTTETAP